MLEAITTPQHIQDEATGDVGKSSLNKFCIEHVPSLFQNKKTKWNFAARTPKKLAVIESKFSCRMIYSKADHKYVVCFQRGYQQQLKCASTLLSKGTPIATVMCKYLAFKMSPTANVMCRCSAFKGAPPASLLEWDSQRRNLSEF